MLFNVLWLLLGTFSISRSQLSEKLDPDVVVHDLLVTGKSAMSEGDYQRKLEAFWTPERMKAAKPMSLRTHNGTGNRGQQAPSKAVDAERGATVIINGELPGVTGSGSRVATSAFLPTQTAGKVYFTLGFYTYTCSASVVSSPSKSLVVTAAHCVYDVDTQQWATDWMFVPAYDASNEPRGRWSAKRLVALKQYTDSTSFGKAIHYDVAFAVMSRVSNRRIADVTGSQGIAFNLARTGITYSFGYPANIADGEIMSSCMGRYLSENCGDSTFVGPSRRCGMEGGSSGGPWLQRFNDTTGLGTITSVTSFGCPYLTPYVVYGPAFNSRVQTLYNSIRSAT